MKILSKSELVELEICKTFVDLTRNDPYYKKRTHTDTKCLPDANFLFSGIRCSLSTYILEKSVGISVLRAWVVVLSMISYAPSSVNCVITHKPAVKSTQYDHIITILTGYAADRRRPFLMKQNLLLNVLNYYYSN